MNFQGSDFELRPLTLEEWRQFWRNRYRDRQMSYAQNRQEYPEGMINKMLGSCRHFEIVEDYCSGRVLEVDGFEQVLGIDSKQPTRGRAEYLVSLVHPDDVGKVLGLSVYFHRLVENQPEPVRANYKGSINFRMRKKTGEYVRVLEQVSFITDSSGMIAYEFKHFTDITHFHDSGNIVLAILNEDKAAQRQCLHTFDLDRKIADKVSNEEVCAFSEREMQVLELIRTGKTSKEVAAALQLSQFTVNKHRENMMRKTNSKNISEVLSFAYRNKYL